MPTAKECSNYWAMYVAAENSLCGLPDPCYTALGKYLAADHALTAAGGLCSSCGPGPKPPCPQRPDLPTSNMAVPTGTDCQP
jgi:hypothetical protein